MHLVKNDVTMPELLIWTITSIWLASERPVP